MSKNINYYDMVNEIMATNTEQLTTEDIYRDYFLGQCLRGVIKRRLASICNPTVNETVFPEMERLYMLYGVEVRPLKARSPLVKIEEGGIFTNSVIILHVNQKYYKDLVELISNFYNKFNLGEINDLVGNGVSFSPSYGFLDFVDSYNQEVYSVFGEDCDKYTIDLEKEKENIKTYAESLFSDKVDTTIIDIFLEKILLEFIKDDLIELSSGRVKDEKTPILHLLGFDRSTREDWSSGYYSNFGTKTYLINGSVDFQNVIKHLITSILDAYDVHYSKSFSELRIIASIEQLLNLYYMEEQRLKNFMDDRSEEELIQKLNESLGKNKNEGLSFVKKS